MSSDIDWAFASIRQKAHIREHYVKGDRFTAARMCMFWLKHQKPMPNRYYSERPWRDPSDLRRLVYSTINSIFEGTFNGNFGI
jgi:hypothetical protein